MIRCPTAAFLKEHACGRTLSAGPYGNNWYEYIFGYGAVDIGSGPVRVTVQCINGSATASARLDYDSGEYGIEFSNWVPIPIPAPPAVTLNPVTTPTRLVGQTISGTRKSGSAVSISCPTAVVSEVSYPTDTTWSATLSTMQQGINTITVTARDTAGNVTTVSGTIQANLPLVSCTVNDDNNGEYQKSCTVQCESSDSGFTVDIGFYGNNWYQYINGYGAVDIGGGARVIVQCINGSATASARIDYDSGDYGIDFSNWVPVPK